MREILGWIEKHSGTEDCSAGDQAAPKEGAIAKEPAIAAEQEEYRTYLCEYPYQCGLWSIEIPATSKEEAEERLRSLASGRVLGEIEAKIPYRLGWLVPVYMEWKRFQDWLKRGSDRSSH